ADVRTDNLRSIRIRNAVLSDDNTVLCTAEVYLSAITQCEQRLVSPRGDVGDRFGIRRCTLSLVDEGHGSSQHNHGSDTGPRSQRAPAFSGLLFALYVGLDRGMVCLSRAGDMLGCRLKGAVL